MARYMAISKYGHDTEGRPEQMAAYRYPSYTVSDLGPQSWTRRLTVGQVDVRSRSRMDRLWPEEEL